MTVQVTHLPHEHAAVEHEAIDSSSSQETLVDIASNLFERGLGDTELSYFLPSRESGVNDMWAIRPM
jgi:hypothetical protein